MTANGRLDATHTWLILLIVNLGVGAGVNPPLCDPSAGLLTVLDVLEP